MNHKPFDSSLPPAPPPTTPSPSKPVAIEPEPTPSVLIAIKDSEVLQTTELEYTALLVYPDATNQGNIWIGGPDVIAGKGIPLKNCAPMKIEKPATYAYFEKAGDKLYRLDW